MERLTIAVFSVRGTIPTPKEHIKPKRIKRGHDLRCSWCGEKGCVGTCTLPPEILMVEHDIA